MGKFMRKNKASGEVDFMEVGGTLLGGRTRSRTLALQQRTSSPIKRAEEAADPAAGAGDYLELRSRRLEKQPPPGPKEKEAAANPETGGVVHGLELRGRHRGLLRGQRPGLGRHGEHVRFASVNTLKMGIFPQKQKDFFRSHID